MKLRPPILATKHSRNPLRRYTLPLKQDKIILKSVFFEQSKHTICGHLVTSYILVITNFMTSLFFFQVQKIMTLGIFGTPQKNDSPLLHFPFAIS